MRTRQELSGKVFGRLLVVSDAPDGHSPCGQPYRMLLCRCECGKAVVRRQSTIAAGLTKSCGCLRFTIEAETKGTDTRRSRAYQAWLGMRDRCYNTGSAMYSRYGGRGIVISPEWLASFDRFVSDMGPHPGKGFSIDRINNDGSYEAGNCQWIPIEVNARKTSSAKVGEEMARQVKALFLSGFDNRRISEMTGLTIPMVYNITAGKTWAWVSLFKESLDALLTKEAASDKVV
jgi:hypothetical protein